MSASKDSNKDASNFINVVFRIDQDQKPYIPIISVGFAHLLNTWEFPHVPKERVKSTRVALSETDREALQYLMKHSGKPAAEIVSAALISAKNSKVRPPKTGDGASSQAEPTQHGSEL
jgi:hypothetical protein